MKLRNKFFPRSLVDIFSFLFISLIVPFGYCFEVLLVLPTFYATTSFWFILHTFAGSFVLVNIVGNFIFILVTDTSVNKWVKPKHQEPTWNFCHKCDIRIPPRAWHCSVCDCCILKRDHHCQFTGCCIGHHNQRYFFFFIVYMAIGTVYALYCHTRYVYHVAVEFMYKDIKYHGSMAIGVALGVSHAIQDCMLLFYGVTLFGASISTFFLFFHFTTMAKGQVMYERSHNISTYDSGSVMDNVVQVLGERWYFAWISPLVTSKLPGDGVKWTQYNFNKRIV